MLLCRAPTVKKTVQAATWRILSLSQCSRFLLSPQEKTTSLSVLFLGDFPVCPYLATLSNVIKQISAGLNVFFMF